MDDTREVLDTWVGSKDLIVKISDDTDGPIIHDLFLGSGKWEIEGLDWTKDMGGYWLIATYYGVPVGCIMVRPGRPFGSLELLCVPTEIPQRHKAVIAITLLRQAMAALKASGSQCGVGILHAGLDDYKKVIEHRGALKWFDGEVYLVGL